MKIAHFGKDHRAATAIEYGLIIALIAIAIMGSLQLMGGGAGGMWAMIADKFTTAINDE